MSALSNGRRLFDRLSLALLALLIVLVGVTFRDYGISTDEYVQQVYGEKLWAFYLSGFADRAVFAYENLFLYGGLFDLLAVALQQFSPFDPYATRHLLCGLIGVLGVCGTWRLGRLLAGPRVGFLAAALLAGSASWYGAMFNNTKDIPFAVAMIWLLHLSVRIVQALPRPPLRLALGFGLVLGLALGLRVGAVLGLIALAIAIAVHLVIFGRSAGWRKIAGDGLAVSRSLLPGLAVAYLVMGLFWPWSVLSPLNPLRAISGLTHFQLQTELDGTIYPTNDLPFYYLPEYLVIKLPELLLAGCMATFVLAAIRLTNRRRDRHPQAAAYALGVLLVLSVALPITYFVVARPFLYNGMRHFFFVVPPLCIIAALGITWLWQRAQAWARPAGIAFAGLLLAAAAREIYTMWQLHPHQYVYFNGLVGGTAGAFRKYEMDYWSNFVPEALDLLEMQLKIEAGGRLPSRRYTVSFSTKNELLKAFDAPFLTATNDWNAADFIVTTTNTDSDKFAGGRTIIEIVRDGAVLGVVKDRRLGTTAQGTVKAPPIR